MKWYEWKFWRLAKGEDDGGFDVVDGDGIWRHIAFGIFFLYRMYRRESNGRD